MEAYCFLMETVLNGEITDKGTIQMEMKMKSTYHISLAWKATTVWIKFTTITLTTPKKLIGSRTFQIEIREKKFEDEIPFAADN